MTLSTARTVTGEFISNLEGRLTAVTVSMARAVTGRIQLMSSLPSQCQRGEFISNHEGKLTVTVSMARAVTGEFISNLEGKLTCCDIVDGENSDRGIHLKS